MWNIFIEDVLLICFDEIGEMKSFFQIDLQTNLLSIVLLWLSIRLRYLTLWSVSTTNIVVLYVFSLAIFLV